MDRTFAPQLSILPKAQLRLWPELVQMPKEFVLYGGTAIALRLGHRFSEDFDFFSAENIDPDRVYSSLSYLAGARITQAEPNTLSCIVDRGGPVKLSFFGVPSLRRLRPPDRAADHGLRVASLFDLAGTKVKVIQQRAQAKDYADIDALMGIGRIALPLQLAAGRAIFGDAFQPTPSLKALSFYGDGDLMSLPASVRQRLTEAAAAVDPLSLPGLDRIGDDSANGSPA